MAGLPTDKFSMPFSLKNREIFSFFGRYGLVVLLLVVLLPMKISQASELPTLPVPGHTSAAIKVLSLHDAIMLALRFNPQVQSSELQRIVDKYSYEVAQNQFQPQYSLTGGATYANGSTPQYNLKPGASLNSPFGTNVAVDVNNTFDGNQVATATITQPLLRGFGPTVTEANLFNAYISELNARLAFKNNIITQIIAVIQAYYTVVQNTNQLMTNKQALATSEQSLQQTKLEIKAGKKASTDAVQQEASVATNRLQVEQAENALQLSYQSLINVLGLSPDSKLKLDQNILLDERPLPTKEQSIEIALKNNVAYQQLLNSYKTLQRQLAVAKNAQLWQLNATGTASQNIAQNGNGPNSPTPASSSLSLSLSVPIDNMTLKQELVNAKIGLEQAELNLYNTKRALTTQVINGYDNLMSQKQQIVLSENDVRLAEQSLKIENLRYSAGLDPPINLIQVRNDLQAKQLNLINQKISYLNNLENFFALLGTTLDRWNIKLTY